MTGKQNILVFEHLRERGPITPIQALNSYGIFRLGARIFELRQMGHLIITHWVTNDYGNRYAEYHLLRQADR
jgi:hypothetical protein